jgi:hypothetical protein
VIVTALTLLLIGGDEERGTCIYTQHRHHGTGRRDEVAACML